MPSRAHSFLRTCVTAFGPGVEITNHLAGHIASTLRHDPALCDEVADELDYHGLTLLLEPVLLALLKADPDALPALTRREYFARVADHRHRAAIREASVDHLIAAFQAEAIPVILLKGAVLAHTIYPEPEFRPSIDIDILVDGADTARAVAAMEALGYAFAERHSSRYAARMHHLPPATRRVPGGRSVVELHTDTMPPNQSDSITYATLSEPPRVFERRGGPAGLALGHTDMLRHLARHVFEPARTTRLIHLYDLWRYQTIFHDEIDWPGLSARFSHVLIALQLACHVFPGPQFRSPHLGPDATAPSGVGCGMSPLAEITESRETMIGKLRMLFDPPAWWLHGFYAVPLTRSLLPCRLVRHPATVARWLAARAVAAAGVQQSR